MDAATQTSDLDMVAYLHGLGVPFPRLRSARSQLADRVQLGYDEEEGARADDAGLLAHRMNSEKGEIMIMEDLSSDTILFYVRTSTTMSHLGACDRTPAHPRIGVIGVSALDEEMHHVEGGGGGGGGRNKAIAQRIEGANAPALTTAVQKASTAAGSEQYTVKKPSAPAVDETALLNSRLKQLINSNEVMIFIKGTPEQPRCGFSRQLLEILNEKGVEYGSYNILADEEVRSGLKAYSNWPTYPQIYVKGELVGGLDIVKELVSSGEFDTVFPKPEPLETKLTRLINKGEAMLFMKGSPATPRCGFSRQIVKILDDLSIKYEYFDILEDDEVRAGLKEFSNWPTYPQLYVKGNLVGGLDIVKEMVAAGELQAMLQT
ncbi:Glutaredoxin 3 [Phlyctochytrium bullatum]|nr:Glutaredoxin 3 [Phlyctochytrium bullatum]